jgi:D-alanyl-D-alanine carboxypeptidase/D-alanyl-D-alanine-endopeptidase (penicillin-binding protein 4)
VLAPALPDELGTVSGDIVLRGGGDPTFGATEASRFAGQLAASGLVRVEGGVIGDDSAFDRRRGVPYRNFAVTSETGPLSALSFNRGLTGKRRPYFQTTPPRFAALAFEKALERRGVEIAGRSRSGLAASGMVALSEWNSPAVGEIVRRMNQPSDNFIAETLLKALGAEFGGAGSTAVGGEVVRSAVDQFGIAPRIVDGSGLARTNRTTPRQVVRLLTGMDGSAVAAPFDASLAVAGRSGTLARRMRGTAAAGRCRAKTGTLHDVSALAGFCDTRGGQRVAFAFLMNYVWPGSARVLQDRMTAALARYDATG